MKVFIAADMEGATGVAHPEHLMPGGDDYQPARRWYTGDVNAAVEGAVAAGAEEVWVNDGHGTMRNLLIDGLHEAARLVVGPARSSNKPLNQVTGVESDAFAACILVGFHSRAGTPGGLLSHTWVGRLVHEIRIQGQPAGEILLNAAIVGHYDVPLVLVTGADDACNEASADLGPALKTVAVKKTLGPTACASLVPTRAQALIRAAAEEAVRERDKVQPWKPGGAVELEVTFHRREMATRASEAGDSAPGGDDRTLRYEAADVPTAVKSLWRGLEMALREDAAFLK